MVQFVDISYSIETLLSFIRFNLSSLVSINRLTFWLSNSIVLRTIISQTLEKLQLPARSVNHEIGVNISDGVELETNGFSTNKGGESNTTEGSDGWDDPQVFMLALEKFEAWIFSRIVESVWWQVSHYVLLFLNNNCFLLFPSCVYPNLFFSCFSF